MKFKYDFKLPVPVERAWPVLLDLPRVAPCMPGAAIESGDGSSFVGRMKVKLGPIEMTYKGDLRFIERDDPDHRVRVEGLAKEIRGGGNAKAIVMMQTAAIGPDACSVSIDVDYTLSGKAAQFGTGMIDEIGSKLMKEFVRRLERLIGQNNALEGSLASPTVQQKTSPGTEPPLPAEPHAATGVTAALVDAPTEKLSSGQIPTPVSTAGFGPSDHDDNEALDLIGLAWGPVVSRALPIVNLVISAITLIWVITHR